MGPFDGFANAIVNLFRSGHVFPPALDFPRIAQ